MQGSDHPSGRSHIFPAFFRLVPPISADFRRFLVKCKAPMIPQGVPTPFSADFRRFPPILARRNHKHMSVARRFGRSVPIFSHDSGLLHSEVPAETILAEVQAKRQQSRLWQTSRPKVGQKSRFWLVGTTRNQTDLPRFVVLRFFSSHFCTSSL